jgi:hypothetical protein
MSKLISKASSSISQIPEAKFESFNLSENPFPLYPMVNKDSDQKKSNGSIYEKEIRNEEYQKVINNFIKTPQSDVNHLRLGFLVDSSYIGRGNGKSAFFVNLLKEINEEFAIDLSGGINKCFSIHFTPEGSGNTKTFRKFVDLFFESIIKTNVIDYALAMIRIDAIIKLKGNGILSMYENDEVLISSLNKHDWYNSDDFGSLGLMKKDINDEIFKNVILDQMNESFPLMSNKKSFTRIVNQKDFEDHYYNLKSETQRLEFVFNDLVAMFIAAGFNGSYILVDDFERIPEFQSGIQRKDFITQLRTVLYDGLNLNAKVGFYNFIFALHAGIPRLIQEAWSLAGLEQRVPLNPKYKDPKHIIVFDKINEKHVELLLKKYLKEFRIDDNKSNKLDLYPFTSSSAKAIGILSEFNASKILQFSCNILDYAISKSYILIDDKVVEEYSEQSAYKTDGDKKEQNISNTESVNLMDKSNTNG